MDELKDEDTGLDDIDPAKAPIPLIDDEDDVDAVVGVVGETVRIDDLIDEEEREEAIADDEEESVEFDSGDE